MTYSSFNIGHVKVGRQEPPFIIAEMSGNQNQSLDRALAIVDAAAEAGAQALKLQTYTAETMTLDVDSGDFFIDEPTDPWKGRSMFDLYQEAHTPWDWHGPIFERCREKGMVCFSTPFDLSSLAFLEELGAPAYKIASFESNDIPLIEAVAATGKPLVVSTGMATLKELDEAVTAARKSGCKDLVLLRCVSTYPAKPEDSNLRSLPVLRDAFDVEVGLSDHTMGIGVAVAAVALGATVIEKHFTLNRADGGVDSEFSMEPSELRALVEETRRAWLSLGKVHFGPTQNEAPFVKDRRSIYVTRNLKRGDRLSEDNIRVIRPGHGLAPKHWNRVLGLQVNQDLARGTALQLEHLTHRG